MSGTEFPDLDRAANSRQILHEANDSLVQTRQSGKTEALVRETIARQHAEIETLESILLAIDHTLEIHGKIDGDSDLHKRVRTALERCGSSTYDAAMAREHWPDHNR